MRTDISLLELSVDKSCKQLAESTVSISTDPVHLVVRDHDEQLTLEARRAAAGYEHVLWPAAAAEVEALEDGTTRRPVRLQVPERLLERDGDGRILGLSVYCVAPRSHQNATLLQSTTP